MLILFMHINSSYITICNYYYIQHSNILGPKTVHRFDTFQELNFLVSMMVVCLQCMYVCIMYVCLYVTSSLSLLYTYEFLNLKACSRVLATGLLTNPRITFCAHFLDSISKSPQNRDQFRPMSFPDASFIRVFCLII